MNDEQGFDPPPMSPEERRRSRWAVQPGSVSDSLAFRRPEGMADEPRRRPASEIIHEIRGGSDAEPAQTQRTEHQPAADQRKTGAVASPAATSDRPDTPTGSTTAAAKAEAAPARATLHDESRRVHPDLGENRDLRAATGGSSSALVMAGFGGVVMVLVGALVGAIVDYLFTDRLGVVTTIGLTIGAAAAALITRKRDLVSVMVAPPIVYALIAIVVLAISDRAVSVTSLADIAIRGFPAMALATGVAALIAGVRLLTSRVGERR